MLNIILYYLYADGILVPVLLIRLLCFDIILYYLYADGILVPVLLIRLLCVGYNIIYTLTVLCVLSLWFANTVHSIVM